MTKDERIDQLCDEVALLRTALNNLVGVIINKDLTDGLEDELEEARDALELKTDTA